MTYLYYSPSLEDVDEGETKTFEKIAESFTKLGDQVADQEGRASRVSHAKATGLLTGQLIIHEGLPPELAQGIAAASGNYEAFVRFAQGPGENLSDRISTHRGMAIKLLCRDGEFIDQSAIEKSQDFVLEGTGKAFINATAGRFLANLKGGVSNAPSLSEGVKNAVSKVSHVTERGLEAVGLHSKTLDFFGHPPHHPLAEPYFSQVPIRWGDYVGKLGVYPTQATIDSLSETMLDQPRDHDAFREAMVEHFASKGAEFDLCVQLAIDLETTPIEDASVEWPEETNPYRRVARLVIEPQNAWSSARDEYFERMSFRPSHSLVEHRPLGQVMRARLFVYAKLAAFRQHRNGKTPVVPAIADVPA